MLTNSYLPSNNISSKEFLDFKFQYLIKKKDFKLIKKFLIKNPSIKDNDKIIRFYIDYHLSNSQLDKSCEIFDHVKIVTSNYLNNFKIYCLIDQNKNIIVNNSLGADDIKLAGLYDPAENGLSIDMWSNSNGKEIKYFLEKLSSKKLSKFSEKIL